MKRRWKIAVVASLLLCVGILEGRAQTLRLDSVSLFNWDTVYDFTAKPLPLDTSLRQPRSTFRIMRPLQKH